jgi:hypothetical protein
MARGYHVFGRLPGSVEAVEGVPGVLAHLRIRVAGRAL